MNRYIICCAGKGDRWANHTGVPKHLVQIDGVPVLHRTVFGIQARDQGADIVILAPTDAWAVPGTKRVAPTSTALPETALGHSDALWLPQQRNVVLFGDVFFSHLALDLVCGESWPARNPTWFGRYGKGKSGHGYGELFGVSIPSDGQGMMRNAFRNMRAVKKANVTRKRNRLGGWECYRLLHGIPIDTHRVGDDFIEIDDETEDFDQPADLTQWLSVFRPPLGGAILDNPDILKVKFE